MADCLFCKIVAAEIPAGITYQDDGVLAFRDINPKAPMHELVIPKAHVASLREAEPGHAEILGRLMLVAAARARDNGHAERGFRVVMNTGPDAGQTVFHAHLHVLAGRPLDWPPG